jgi:hypothetical protein
MMPRRRSAARHLQASFDREGGDNATRGDPRRAKARRLLRVQAIRYIIPENYIIEQVYL